MEETFYSWNEIWRRTYLAQGNSSIFNRFFGVHKRLSACEPGGLFGYCFCILLAFFYAKVGFWRMTRDEKAQWNQWWRRGDDF
jgi:hypothetical protein